ncbi:MAG: hypothetical protein M1609_05420 [Firmicutes bacterium]|nr:hypothetical protein [Bacillota bacterium]
MFSIFGIIVVSCLIAAYFQKGLKRALLIVLAVAILELKSLAVGVKIFSLTVIIGIVMFYLLTKTKGK